MYNSASNDDRCPAHRQADSAAPGVGRSPGSTKVTWSQPRAESSWTSSAPTSPAIGQLTPVPASHFVTRSALASRNFLAASSSLSLSTAIDFETAFCCSLDHWKFLITV